MSHWLLYASKNLLQCLNTLVAKATNGNSRGLRAQIVTILTKMYW